MRVSNVKSGAERCDPRGDTGDGTSKRRLLTVDAAYKAAGLRQPFCLLGTRSHSDCRQWHVIASRRLRHYGPFIQVGRAETRWRLSAKRVMEQKSTVGSITLFCDILDSY